MDLDRPLSWSAISSFRYDKDQWYKKYVLKQREPETPEMAFGKFVGERLASDPDYLQQVPRYSVFEHELRTELNSIPLIGFIDSYDPETHNFLEYKTGKRPWTQERADSHGQIDMYLLMLHLINGVDIENVDIKLVWLPTEDQSDFSIDLVNKNHVQIFKTKRTTADLFEFGKGLLKTYEEMKIYGNK